MKPYPFVREKEYTGRKSPDHSYRKRGLISLLLKNCATIFKFAESIRLCLFSSSIRSLTKHRPDFHHVKRQYFIRIPVHPGTLQEIQPGQLPGSG